MYNMHCYGVVHQRPLRAAPPARAGAAIGPPRYATRLLLRPGGQHRFTGASTIHVHYIIAISDCTGPRLPPFFSVPSRSVAFFRTILELSLLLSVMVYHTT